VSRRGEQTGQFSCVRASFLIATRQAFCRSLQCAFVFIVLARVLLLHHITHFYQVTSISDRQFLWLLCKVVPYSIMSGGHGADPGFLAVSRQVTLVINPVVDCRYFSLDPQLPSQPKRPAPWLVPNYTAW